MNDVTRYKNRLTVYLDQIFPGYDKVFSDIGGASSRAVLRECPTPQILLLKNENELVHTICIAGYKSPAFGREKVEKFRCAAEEAKQIGLYAPGNAAVVTSVKSIWEIDQDIKALVMQEPLIQKNIMVSYNKVVSL